MAFKGAYIMQVLCKIIHHATAMSVWKSRNPEAETEPEPEPELKLRPG